MSLNTKKLKKIRRFGKLRFANKPVYSDKVLIGIYEKAGEQKRKMLDDEMTEYFEAINAGELKPGDSIVKLAFPE